jgi:uncharacterized protein
MVGLFMVIKEQGPSWKEGVPMREQKGWTEHAAFIDRLFDEGLVVLAGPLGAGPAHRSLHIMRSLDESSLRSRMGGDPWIRAGLLRVTEVQPWELLLGQLPEPVRPRPD